MDLIEFGPTEPLNRHSWVSRHVTIEGIRLGHVIGYIGKPERWWYRPQGIGPHPFVYDDMPDPSDPAASKSARRAVVAYINRVTIKEPE